MSYTFTETETFAIDDTFDSLYADSLADLEGGTVYFNSDATPTEKKNWVIKLMNEQDYHNMKNIIIAKDGIVCMYIQGRYQDNTYTWMNTLVGKLNNSKSWCSSSEFHQANKDWIQSLGGTKFALQFIKDSAIDTFFTGIHNAGICLGTLSTEDLADNMKRMTWEY